MKASIKKETKEARKKNLRWYGLYSVHIQLTSLMRLGFASSYSIHLFLAIPSIWLRILSSSHTNSAFVFSILLLASILCYDRASNELNCKVTNSLPVKIHFRSTYKLPTRHGLDLSRSDRVKSTYSKMCTSADGIKLDPIMFRSRLKR